MRSIVIAIVVASHLIKLCSGLVRGLIDSMAHCCRCKELLKGLTVQVLVRQMLPQTESILNTTIVTQNLGRRKILSQVVVDEGIGLVAVELVVAHRRRFNWLDRPYFNGWHAAATAGAYLRVAVELRLTWHTLPLLQVLGG